MSSIGSVGGAFRETDVKRTHKSTSLVTGRLADVLREILGECAKFNIVYVVDDK